MNTLFLRTSVWILAGAELDSQWSTDQCESFTEMLFQITFVVIFDRFQRVAVNNDDRRVLSALVRITQFRTDRTLAPRLLMLHRFDQCTRQFRRGQVSHGRSISRIDRLHERTDPSRFKG